MGEHEIRVREWKSAFHQASKSTKYVKILSFKLTGLHLKDFSIYRNLFWILRGEIDYIKSFSESTQRWTWNIKALQDLLENWRSALFKWQWWNKSYCFEKQWRYKSKAIDMDVQKYYNCWCFYSLIGQSKCRPTKVVTIYLKIIYLIALIL